MKEEPRGKDTSIEDIARDWSARMRELHPRLVRSPRFEDELEERALPVPGDDT